LLPDVLVQHERGCLAQMIDAAAELGERANIVAVEEVPAERGLTLNIWRGRAAFLSALWRSIPAT
jgi:UTP-glucose-1-phosphate uridylyltransferase